MRLPKLHNHRHTERRHSPVRILLVFFICSCRTSHISATDRRLSTDAPASFRRKLPTRRRKLSRYECEAFLSRGNMCKVGAGSSGCPHSGSDESGLRNSSNWGHEIHALVIQLQNTCRARTTRNVVSILSPLFF